DFHVQLNEPRHVSLFEDREGVFWILSTGAGLAALDRDNHRLIKYRFQGLEPSENVGVSSVLEDAEGGLWFGTGGAGLLKFDRAHQRFAQYRHVRDEAQSLASDTIALRSLIEDREGDIWVALEGSVPQVFPRRPSKFERLPAGPKGGATVT